MTSHRTLIVGAGLMGTSLGLALRGTGWDVWITDVDSRAARLAGDLGAGAVGRPESPPELVVVAVPPSHALDTLIKQHRIEPSCTLSDLGSVKANLQVQVETNRSLRSAFVGGHPLAGRERSGAGAARADLFEGRPWVLTPGATVPGWRTDVVLAAVEACGALPVVMGPGEHDDAVALVSHAPQVVASAMAAQLVGGTPTSLELSGQGLRDTVRIAASDPELWGQILQENAGPVATALRGVADDLVATAAALESLDQSIDRESDESIKAATAVRDLLQRGKAGQALIPGKHGAPPASYAQVPVVIPDEPGALAALFLAAGQAGVNIEDVHIEHSPGQPVGLVELAVNPATASTLADRLREAGWLVH